GGARIGDDRARVVDLVTVDPGLLGVPLVGGDQQRDRLPRRPAHREAVGLLLLEAAAPGPRAPGPLARGDRVDQGPVEVGEDRRGGPDPCGLAHPPDPTYRLPVAP